MARGNGGEDVFVTDDDRKSFLFRLGLVCVSHGWKVHAWVLMGNHFHLLLETPQANLVSGMKQLLGTFSQGWNRVRHRHGHVFQGRYKSIPVNGADTDVDYFKALCDYIHLNPARAGLAGGAKGPLVAYRWSSLPSHHKGNGPDWLVDERLLRAFQLAADGRGRRAYVAWLESRATNAGGKISDEATDAIRRGWYLGQETFKDKLLKLLESPALKRRNGTHRTRGPHREHGEKEALRMMCEGAISLGLPSNVKELSCLKKSDERKIRLAIFLRTHTSVSNQWIADKLVMGHPGSVSRIVSASRTDKAQPKSIKELEKLLIREH